MGELLKLKEKRTGIDMNLDKHRNAVYPVLPFGSFISCLGSECMYRRVGMYLYGIAQLGGLCILSIHRHVSIDGDAPIHEHPPWHCVVETVQTVGV